MSQRGSQRKTFTLQPKKINQDIDSKGSEYRVLDQTHLSKADITVDEQLGYLEASGMANQRGSEGNTHGSGFPLSFQGIQPKPPSKNRKKPLKPKIAAANYGIMQRDNSKLDRPTVFTDKQQVKEARSNMQDYMENFGIEFPIPALFVKDAVIYPVQPTYCIQVIKYAFPISDQYSVSTHNLDGKSSVGTFKELFSQYTRGLVLRLLKREQSSLNKIGEVALNAQEALMEFHHEGDMFAFFFRETQQLKVTYIDEIDNFVEMLKTLEDVEHDDQYFVDYNGPAHGQDLSFIEKIKFDTGKKFLIGWGGTQVFLMNMELNVGEIIEINERLYHDIYHCNIISSDQFQDYSYTFYVACQRNDIKQIVIFDLDEELALRDIHKTKYHGQKLQSMMTINYLEDLQPDFRLMVSHDNKQVVFTNGMENSILEVMDDGRYYNQRKLKHLKNKIVRHVQQDYKQGGFYFLACQQFDKFLSVEHSNRESTSIRFARLIEPDVIKIFDLHIKTAGKPFTHEGKRAIKKELRILSMRDDEFMLDRCSYDEINLNQKKQKGANEYLQSYTQINNEYVYFIYSPLRAYSVMWPYVVLSGLANFVLIVNAYDRKVLRRIQVGSRDAKITINETFITETMDLYVLIQEGDLYMLYHIDLDASNQFEHDASTFDYTNQYKFSLIFCYKSETVKNRPITQIHVRGSSSKDEQYDMNEKLQVLFLHGDDLYVWVQTHPDDTNVFQDLKWASKCTSALYKDRDSTVYFMHIEKNPESKTMVVQEIKRLTCLFSTFEIQVIYKEIGQTEKLKTMNLDAEANKIVIFSRKTDDRGASLERKNIVKILCYDHNKIIHESHVSSPELVGRLKTGLYTLSNGHIFYNNNCIKIRYDILDSNQGHMLSETEIMDQYLDCFPLKPNEKIRVGTPLDSQKNHRFVYIKRDKDMNDASQILILPYLHERRIYMNTKKLATEYFYTSIITTVEQENEFRAAYQRTKMDNGSVTDIDILDIVDNAGSTKGLVKQKSLLGKSEILSSLGSGKDEPAEPEQFTSIICMKITESKYYVYSQNGVLINRVDFGTLVDAYGEPVQTSSSGQVYILKKTRAQLEDMIADGYSKQEQAQEFASVSVVKLTVFGMQHVKTVNLMHALQDFFKTETSKQAKFMQENRWFMNDSFEFLHKHIKYDILVNNMMDILVRITYVVDPENPIETKLQKPEVDNQIYYYESIKKLAGNKKQQESQGLSYFGGQDSQELATCMLRPKNSHEKFIFNKKYLFVWNNREIEYFVLGEPFTEHTKKQLSFSISPDAVGTRIVDIRCGSNPVNIVIIVEYNPGGYGVGSEKCIDTVIWWNMDTDLEEESNEIRDDYLVLWGSAGNPYIITQKKVYFIKQRCAITAFDYEGAIEAFKENSSTLSVHKGHRVDGHNHNWLIFEEYLSLPFDYMTFVIKDKIENEDDCVQDKIFDPVPYNYVYNKATSFTEGDFVTNDHEQLHKVLSELKQIDIDHVEIINYTNEVIVDGQKELNSALHRAVEDGNQRAIDSLLEYMSYIDVNSSANYLSIISDLLDYEQFHSFLQELPSQTKVMQEKQIFRCDEPVNDKIIRQIGKNAIFFTDDFYAKEMNEMPKENSHPVRLCALRVDWIVNTDEGRSFMQNILFTGNLDFFNIDTLQYLVEFLFQKFKYVIFFLLTPIYIFSHFAYFFLQYYNDAFNEALYERYENADDPEGSISLLDIPRSDKNKVYIAGAICFVSWFLQFVQVLIFIYYGGLDYFKKLYSQLDILYICSVAATFYIMIDMHRHTDLKFKEYELLVKTSRQIACLGYFSLYFKGTYFLSLIDSVAPLIDIIFQIFFDIKWFMIVSAWFILMYAQCYDLIAKSQVKFDHLTTEEKASLQYYGFSNALWYMIQTFLGGASTDGFYLGDKSQQLTLKIMFFTSTFLIITHFLNMLIAIMGNTFGERAEVQSQIMTRDHLRFVVDNFHLLPVAIPDKSTLKYIITSSLVPEEKEMSDEQRGAWITEQLQSMEKRLMDRIEKNEETGADTNRLVSELVRKNLQDSKRR